MVERDEREAELRHVLNHGHTIGHAIEAATGFEAWTHGEAVALGMAAEARLAHRLGIAGEETVARTETLLVRLGQVLIAEQDDEMLVPSGLDSGDGSGVQRLAEIEPADFSPDRIGQGDNRYCRRTIRHVASKALPRLDSESGWIIVRRAAGSNAGFQRAKSGRGTSGHHRSAVSR